MDIPRHIAIVPDGNRRWAKKQAHIALFGHTAGVKAFQHTAEYALKRGVEYLSLWGMSLDNFNNRSRIEIRGLMGLFEQEFKRLVKDPVIHEEEVRIRVIGRWDELFPLPVKKAIEQAQEATVSYKRRHLTFFLAYNGTDEMLQATAKLTRRSTEPKFELTEAALKDALWTRDLPPVDLLIRTGGEPHLSAGFMMWDMADAQLYFTEKLWPEFTTEVFQEALDEYKRRQRRFGR